MMEVVDIAMMRSVILLMMVCVLGISGYQSPNCPYSGPSEDVLGFSRDPDSLRIVCDGMSDEIYCCVNGYSYMHWQKYDQVSQTWLPLQQGINQYLTAQDKNQTLRFDDLDMAHDNTMYRCIAEDSQGNAIQHNVFVEIHNCSQYLGDPYFVSPQNSITYRLPGQSFELECKVFFGPNHREEGLLSERLVVIKPLGNSTQLLVGPWLQSELYTTAHILVANISEENYGNYTCIGSHNQWLEARTVQLRYGDWCQSPMCLTVSAATAESKVAYFFVLLILLVGVLVALYRRYRLDVVLFYKDRYKVPPVTSRDKLYDAFLVYNERNDADRSFCINTALPVLDGEHQYRLALIERDSIPGSLHVDSYHQLATSSQCLVFIISRAFLESHYCKYLLNQVIRQEYRNMIFIYREDVPESLFSEQTIAILKALRMAKHVLRWPEMEDVTQGEPEVRAAKFFRRFSPFRGGGRPEDLRAKFWKQLRYALPAQLSSMPEAQPPATYGHRVLSRRRAEQPDQRSLVV